MLYSRSAEYAIRAFVHLARVPRGRFAMTKSIAEAEQIPMHFLAKILQDLARKGLLDSNKGPSGGFALREPAARIHVLDLIEALDGKTLAETADRIPWSLDGWKPLHSRIMEVLGRSTIADIAKALDKARMPSGKPRRSRRAKS